ncbi:hypothetical protein C2E23DRAFT_862781 [Lenzites betulinus]|nr:hypothetical protein C2E23DRAFT_862781 [Lenzites betulinus]
MAGELSATPPGEPEYARNTQPSRRQYPPLPQYLVTSGGLLGDVRPSNGRSAFNTSSTMLSSDSEWEPSQTQDMEDSKSKARPPRSSHAGSRRTRLSNSSTCQPPMMRPSRRNTSPILLIPDFAKEAVDECMYDGPGTVSCCAVVEETNEFLRQEVRRLEALYAAAAYQLDAVRVAVADEAVLDPNKQSQQVLKKPCLYDPWTGRRFPQPPSLSLEARAHSPALYDAIYDRRASPTPRISALSTPEVAPPPIPVQLYKWGHVKALVGRRLGTILAPPSASEGEPQEKLGALLSEAASETPGASSSTTTTPAEPKRGLRQPNWVAFHQHLPILLPLTALAMHDLERPQDFEIDGRLGRCIVCTQGPSGWTKLGNLRTHEKQKTHKDNAAEAQRCASQSTGTSSGGRRPFQAYVEDCADDTLGPPPPVPAEHIPWFSMPTYDELQLPTVDMNVNSGQQRGPYGSRDLPVDMQDALAGAVDFSSMDMPAPQGLSDVTLEDVLSGAGLLEAVMGVGEVEERPCPPSMLANPAFDIVPEELGSCCCRNDTSGTG